MPHSIVVIGASAGGVEALSRLAAELPKDLPAAVFISHHFPSNSISVLPAILNRSGCLPASHAQDGEEIKQGRIYVAPPDYHLLVEDRRMFLSKGPKENGYRPSIDTMFRSAARTFGRKVIGVILTGMLDDGVAGLMAVKARGGVALVQDPNDAFSSSMPSSAIKRVAVDRISPISEMGAAIAEFVVDGNAARTQAMDEATRNEIVEEMQIGDAPRPISGPEQVPGDLTMYTCPECHGTLWEVAENDVLRYRCHVGHSFTEESFVSEKFDEIESALWSALRALQEQIVIIGRMKSRAEIRGSLRTVKRLEENCEEAERRMASIRNVLLKGRDYSDSQE